MSKQKKSVLFKRGVKMEKKFISVLSGVAGIAFAVLSIIQLIKEPAEYGSWLPFLALGAIFCLAAWAIARKKI